jgi:hypothetical protein
VLNKMDIRGSATISGEPATLRKCKESHWHLTCKNGYFTIRRLTRHVVSRERTYGDYFSRLLETGARKKEGDFWERKGRLLGENKGEKKWHFLGDQKSLPFCIASDQLYFPRIIKHSTHQYK